MTRGIILGLTLAGNPLCADWDLAKMVTGPPDRPVYHPLPTDARFRNPWPKGMEQEFQARARAIVGAIAGQKGSVNTYFENEKRTYGTAMTHLLSGDADKVVKALKDLQSQDHQHEEWHRETDGIDYYAAFTLKHQMRKYFYFGDLLDPAYRRRMFTGARKWTAQDPMRRPHYAHEGKKEGWGPDARNSWVDIRSTENLYLMRVTSVYLMAEETGNTTTAGIYRKHILDYTKTLYRIGIGEWDSENYLGHSIAPLLNLHDFARDQEVRMAAKACLDFYAAAGAVKYFRGGFNGPTKRDYNHAQPFGGSAANALWVWFGDHPAGKTGHWESDEVHMITSAYRPPLAVVQLARKQVDQPVEIFASKPGYSATTSYRADSSPEYLETQFLGHSFLMGSLTGGTSTDGGDVNGFKILAWDKEDGAVALHAVPGPDPAFPGSPLYKHGKVSGPNRVAQLENLALWLVKDGSSPWLWVIPEDVEVSTRKGVTFLCCDRTWVAVHPLGTGPLTLDRALTGKLISDKTSRFPGHKVLRCDGGGGQFCGLAIEIGERESHQSLAGFQSAALAAEVDLDDLQTGAVRYRTANKNWLGIHWNDDPHDLGVWRNGQRRDLGTHATHLYDSPPIRAVWGTGTLTVQAGGSTFRCSVDENGRVTFSNQS